MNQYLTSRSVSLGALLVLHLMANVLFHTTDTSSWFSWDYELTLCEVGLLSWWVALAGKNTVLALSGWVGGMAVLFIFAIYSHLSPSLHPVPWSDIAWAVVLGSSTLIQVLSAPATLLCFLLIGYFLARRGVMLNVVPVGKDKEAQTSKAAKRQLSVRDILIFLTALAASLSVVITLQPYPRWILDGAESIGHILDWRLSLMLAACVIESVSITAAASWFVLGRSHLLARCGIFFLSIILSGLTNSGVSSIVIRTIAPEVRLGVMDFVGGAAATALMLAASFLFLRLSGYQLERKIWLG